MFVAHIGCAALGVAAVALFGPGWLARATSLSASLAFMRLTGSLHPPGKSPSALVKTQCMCVDICIS